MPLVRSGCTGFTFFFFELILAIPITLTEPSGAEMIKALKEQVDLYFDSMAVLMEALDEIAKLHPFIDGASTLPYTLMRRDREYSCRLDLQNCLRSRDGASRQRQEDHCTLC